MGKFASKGLGGTALGLAIPGTVALANQLFSGGGLLNLGGTGVAANTAVAGGGLETKEAACLRAENAMLRSEKYTDQAVIAGNERVNGLFREAFAAIAELDKQSAVNAEREKCQQGQIDRINGVVAELSKEACAMKSAVVGLQSDLRLESERRHCGDERIVQWANGTFIRGTLVLPSTPTVTGFNNGCCNQSGPFSCGCGESDA